MSPWRIPAPPAARGQCCCGHSCDIPRGHGSRAVLCQALDKHKREPRLALGSLLSAGPGHGNTAGSTGSRIKELPELGLRDLCSCHCCSEVWGWPAPLLASSPPCWGSAAGQVLLPGAWCRTSPPPLLECPSGCPQAMDTGGVSPPMDGHLPSFSPGLLFARSQWRERARTCQSAAGETDGE